MALVLSGDGAISGANLNIDSDGAASFAGLTVDTNTLHVDAANNRVGIGTTSPLTKFTVSGGYISQTNAGVSTYFGEDGSGGSLTGTVTNHYFRFITNDTERMRIDASGRVTKPYQPMASVNFTGSGTNTAGTYELVYTTVLVNVGSHYNSSNGRFTCPVAGVYRVSAFGMGTLVEGNYNFFVTVRKNGVQQGATAYNYGTPTDYKHASGNWLVSCAAGDYLSIFAGGGAGYYGEGFQGATFELVG